MKKRIKRVMRSLIVWYMLVFSVGFSAGGCMATIDGIAQDVGSVAQYVDDKVVTED